jgi:CRISPR-associated protein Cas5h
MKVLVFDIWGEYAHFKKIYATTSALTYAIPPKTSIYGYVGAILGLEKDNNEYLKYFENKQCLIGIGIQKTLRFQRLGINLKAELGRKKEGSPPKPTMMEFVHQPVYRIYFSHKNQEIYNKLKVAIEKHHSVYTPCLGLAFLTSNFEYFGEFESEKMNSNESLLLDSVLRRKHFIEFDKDGFLQNDVQIIEQSMYAIEMDLERNVTERDDILLERNGKPMKVKLNEYYQIDGKNICLF